MKKITLVFAIVLCTTLAFAQSKEGDFEGTDISTSGTAMLSDEGAITLSSDFQTEEGPNLHVYLAADTTATDYTDLGLLEDFSGEQSYELPADADTEAQPLVLIYCTKYSHLFGYAELQ